MKAPQPTAIPYPRKPKTSRATLPHRPPKLPPLAPRNCPSPGIHAGGRPPAAYAPHPMPRFPLPCLRERMKNVSKVRHSTTNPTIKLRLFVDHRPKRGTRRDKVRHLPTCRVAISMKNRETPPNHNLPFPIPYAPTPNSPCLPERMKNVLKVRHSTTNKTFKLQLSTDHPQKCVTKGDRLRHSATCKSCTVLYNHPRRSKCATTWDKMRHFTITPLDFRPSPPEYPLRSRPEPAPRKPERRRPRPLARLPMYATRRTPPRLTEGHTIVI